MKKLLLLPEINIVHFYSSDVIATSNGIKQGAPIQSGEFVLCDSPYRSSIWGDSTK